MSDLYVVQSAADALAWLRGRVSGGHLQTDSRKVEPGDAFIAWPGGVVDGRAYVAQAVERGAVACLVELEGVEQFGLQGLPVAALQSLKAATGEIASQWQGEPSAALDVLAVTGTNGKTSISWWLAQAIAHLCEAGVLTHRGSAMVGTLGVGIPPAQLQTTGMTTPDPVLLQAAFRQFVDAGYGACTIEASSIGIVEHRLAGARLKLAIFTNFTQDHLDYHGSMAAYWAAKRALFTWPGLHAAVINVDDPKGAELEQALHSTAVDVWTVSVQATAPARLKASSIRAGERGLVFEVCEGDTCVTLNSQTIGQYNVSNLLEVIASLRVLGVSLQQAVEACAALAPVPGRMEQVTAPHAPLVAVDYSHTPDALEKALQALRPLAVQRTGKLWCVFGCGGNRDATKRPLMGRIAQQRADEIIVTSDNPRGEAPQAIIDAIVHGMAADGGGALWRVQADRAVAIAEAIALAKPQDVILIAGKGHEDYQEVAGVKHPFLDIAQAEKALQQRKDSV